MNLLGITQQHAGVPSLLSMLSHNKQKVSAGNTSLCNIQQKPPLKDCVYNRERRGGFILPETHIVSANTLIRPFLERTGMPESIEMNSGSFRGLKVNLFEQKPFKIW